jgi:hypothetical protein
MRVGSHFVTSVITQKCALLMLQKNVCLKKTIFCILLKGPRRVPSSQQKFEAICAHNFLLQVASIGISLCVERRIIIDI